MTTAPIPLYRLLKNLDVLDGYIAAAAVAIDAPLERSILRTAIARLRAADRLIGEEDDPDDPNRMASRWRNGELDG